MRRKSEYEWHVALVVPAGKRSQASAIAEAEGRVGLKDDFAEFFSVQLSPTGAAPATHYGCHTLMRGRLFDRLPQLKGALGDGEWAVTRNSGGDTGDTFWSLCNLLGLQAVEEPV